MKIIEIRELNPYEQNSTLKMRADFYTVEIAKDINLKPNDLPALLEITIKEFLSLEFNKKESLNKLQEYVIKNKNLQLHLPEYYALMIPKEVKEFLKKVKEYEEKIER